MPEICRFYGIVIGMFYDDHGVPHFHADYSGTEASIAIEPLRILEGELPRRAERFVLEWATLHRDELLEDRRRARERKALLRIDPLD
ncbi:MAG: DUF4160 domain-containing protein [Chloroflexota bacterium]|nr:DUF4160 domain-containing protein [Chloroflexota bacterium]